MPVKLNAEVLARLAPGKIERDTEVKGLIASKTLAGEVRFKFQADLPGSYRNSKSGRPQTVRMTASTDDLGEARRWARQLKNQVSAGVDPRERVTEVEGPATWTVRRCMEEYLKKPSHRPSTQQGIREHLCYLAPLMDKKLGELTKSDCRTTHAKIQAKSAANGGFRYLRAAYNWALKFDDARALPAGAHSPLNGVVWNPVGARALLPFDLADWSERLRTVSVPRRHFHVLNLLGGYRAGMLSRVKWEYVLDDRIVFPAADMKSDREFHSPISTAMREVIEAIPRLDETWMFPAHSRTGHLTEWKEAAIHPHLGHQLRKRYKTTATLIGVPSARSEALLDHAQPGLDKNYESRLELFDKLAYEQERVSQELLRQGLDLACLEQAPV